MKCENPQSPTLLHTWWMRFASLSDRVQTQALLSKKQREKVMGVHLAKKDSDITKSSRVEPAVPESSCLFIGLLQPQDTKEILTQHLPSAQSVEFFPGDGSKPAYAFIHYSTKQDAAVVLENTWKLGRSRFRGRLQWDVSQR